MKAFEHNVDYSARVGYKKHKGNYSEKGESEGTKLNIRHIGGTTEHGHVVFPSSHPSKSLARFSWDFRVRNVTVNG